MNGLVGLLAATSLLLCGYVCGFDRLEIAAAVVICRLVGWRSLKSLIPATLFIFAAFPPLPGFVTNHWPSPEGAARIALNESLVAIPSLNFLALLSRLGLWVAFAAFCSRFSKGTRVAAAHMFFLVSLLGLGQLCLSLDTLAANFFYLLLLQLCTFFFFLCYVLQQHQVLDPKTVVRLGLTPFFESSIVPRPLLDTQPCTTQQSLLDRRCLKICVFLALLVYGSRKFSYWLITSQAYPGLPLPDLGASGLPLSLLEVYSRREILLSLLAGGLFRVTHFFSLFAFLEACFVFLGYSVPQRFRLPLKSRSFGDFYNAIMPYYVILVNQLYLYPLFRWIRLRGVSKKWAYELGLLLAIFLGGFFSHLARDCQIALLLGPWEYLRLSVLTDTPYLLVLYLCLRFAKLPKFLQGIPGLFTFPLWLAVYSFVLSWRAGGLFLPVEERLLFLYRLYFPWTL